MAKVVDVEKRGGGTGSLEELPLELRQNTIVLRGPAHPSSRKALVYLLGTAHVSQDSCKEVRALIREVKPDAVFVELCSGRTAVLMPPKDLVIPTFAEMFDQLRNKKANAFAVIYGYFLARVASRLTVLPGEEFRIAYEEALACGASIKLGDRPIQVTLQRTWGQMPAWHKFKLLWQMLVQASSLPDADELAATMEDLKDTDMLTLAIKEMSKTFPTLWRTLVLERDQYMAASLRDLARTSNRVVAVVGKGHQSGIRENWEAPIDVKALMEMPPEKPPWISKETTRWLLLGGLVGSVALVYTVRYARRSKS
ncbi:hypothetical protein KFL_004060130 [Klebsormidium nitens]|uniref:TraB family protein n=1 Tax=Klebsormidium nitens TaxID=105231 RepID=A0A1Y1IJ83_KLENI|nr:hypothetical protein KFL_004060130 [Klebsormidium nitens]|eukprot:GAQ88178.1 hypothetical protein KFL_004060130 [Klebsormidium nitens]